MVPAFLPGRVKMNTFSPQIKDGESHIKVGMGDSYLSVICLKFVEIRHRIGVD